MDGTNKQDLFNVILLVLVTILTVGLTIALYVHLIQALGWQEALERLKEAYKWIW